MSAQTADVVVVGGGIIGSSIAYHLSSRQISVLLLEEHIPAAGSSGGCDGAVLLQSKKHGLHLQMAMASFERFPEINEQLPFSIEFERNGSMIVIEHEAELEHMRNFVAQQRKHGVNVSLLGAREAREIVPDLSEEIVGATFSPDDGKINPIRLNIAFVQGAKERGAEVRVGEAVENITVKDGRISGVSTSRNDYTCSVVVNAAGARAPEVGRMVELDIPIKPRRGQILVTEAVEPIARCCMLSAGYIAAKFNPDVALQSGHGVSLDQTAKGNILIGSTREFVGYNRQTTFPWMAAIAGRARQIIPRLGRLDVIRSFAGLRPFTPDGLPILGTVEQLEGFVMAAGHEGDGIALSPITGELIAQLIAGEKPSISLEPFNLSRFAEQ